VPRVGDKVNIEFTVVEVYPRAVRLNAGEVYLNECEDRDDNISYLVQEMDYKNLEFVSPPLPTDLGTQILATVGGVKDVWLILAGSASGPLWKTVDQPDDLIGSIYYDHGITEWRLK
jgi:hypothetical protein